jgi:hypothetical protein
MQAREAHGGLCSVFRRAGLNIHLGGDGRKVVVERIRRTLEGCRAETSAKKRSTRAAEACRATTRAAGKAPMETNHDQEEV